MISWQIKQQIIDQTNIVEVVGEVVQLVKKGNNYFGKCPFHDDKNPSMSVSGSKKMFNCFSCHTKGNVIDFYSNFNHITSDQASVVLAKRLGIEISSSLSKEQLKNEKLLNVMKEAKNFYSFYLNNSDEGKLGLEYLNNRGIDSSLIEKLSIGLSSSKPDYLSKALNQKGLSEIDQIEVGLVKLDKDNNPYDVFKDRIMFPITNPSGQVVGFSGRIYKKSDQPKYINSSDNQIFHKNQILYHFYEGYKQIKSENKIFITEGFMDVIAFIKAEKENVVATMGTAFSNYHIELISKITNNITLCFDGDEAGINAMKKACSALSRYRIIPKAIIFPSGLDPDEYLNKYGKAEFLNFISKSEESAYDKLYSLAKKDLILNNIDSVERFKQEVFNIIRISNQNTVIEHFLKLLSNDLNLSYDNLSKDFGKSVIHEVEQIVIKEPIKEVKVFKKTSNIKPKVFRAYQIVLRHMIDSKDSFLRYKEKFEDDLYLDSKLMIYFEIIKKISLFYVQTDVMDKDDFMNIAKSLDLANGTTQYSDLAILLYKNIVNLNDENEFEQCINTISECIKELQQTRLYNKAIDSEAIDDIRSFESSKKEYVKILSKEVK